MMDFATRVHNHNYRLDPIIRSLLDTDFYKFLMHQFIWMLYPKVPVTFGLINRTKTVRLAEIIPEAVLRAQLDHARTLSFRENELIWLAGNRFYGRRDIFRPEYIEYLRSFRLPDYKLETIDGQYVLTFEGDWAEVTMWEIYALAIVSELRSRIAMATLDKFELDILYAQTKTKIWNKIKKLKSYPDMRLAEFGTRRRHGFLWQEWVTDAMANELGRSFVGTSNALLAFKHSFEAIGTNSHELPMVFACLAENDEQLKAAQYDVLAKWQEVYDGELLIILPDTFGMTQFLRDAPAWTSKWTGMRMDSKEPVAAGEEMIAWYAMRGEDPRKKRAMFSDGLEVDLMIDLHQRFRGRIRESFGWGTMATNDFRGAHPRGLDSLDPISLVCKVTYANGRSAVKLSDNPAKTTGSSPAEIERYLRIFGREGVAEQPVIV
ncbi:nicotinate phosphoribosyltransferase [Tardiphaga sp. 813_E8_N1_3]|uniref:nicotinate phosphoribosyltransferase n=1 Tax=Tardiphaga sp. 813_E8_N1_3 TaxID=3240760 RepID=UPI003F21FC6C